MLPSKLVQAGIPTTLAFALLLVTAGGIPRLAILTCRCRTGWWVTVMLCNRHRLRAGRMGAELTAQSSGGDNAWQLSMRMPIEP